MPAQCPNLQRCPSEQGLWTPISLGVALSLWLDAPDVSTIKIDGGVSQWLDKSGNNRHAATTVRKPVLLHNVQNGLSAIKFTKSSATKLDTPDFSIAPDRKFCTFAVASGAGLISSSSYPRIWVAKGAGDSAVGGSTYSQGFLGAGASNGSAAFLAGASSPLTPEITGISTTLPVLISGRFGSSGLAADNISIAINGGSQTSASGRTGSLSTTGVRIGSDVGTSTISAWDSWIGEVILTLDISFRVSQIIEGYLAWKWGLTQNLPAAHPYRLNPPRDNRILTRKRRAFLFMAAAGAGTGGGSLSGEIPMPTGALTASHSQSVTVAGEIPMPTGALTATHDQAVAIAGDIPMPTGAITATHAQDVTLSGTIPIPTGAITASHSQDVTVDGSIPMPFGNLYDTVPVSGVSGGAARRHYVPSFKPGQSQNWFKINRAKMLGNDDDEVAIIASISVILASVGLDAEEVEYANA